VIRSESSKVREAALNGMGATLESPASFGLLRYFLSL
jgi:hypothetical protein